MESAEHLSALRRELRLRDLVFFDICAIISLRWIAAAAHAGPGSLLLWLPHLLLAADMEKAVWAAFVAPAEDVGGRYCENCHVSMVTEGLISPVSEGVRPYALDPEHARALWAKSEEMVGERF